MSRNKKREGNSGEKDTGGPAKMFPDHYSSSRKRQEMVEDTFSVTKIGRGADHGLENGDVALVIDLENIESSCLKS